MTEDGLIIYDLNTDGSELSKRAIVEIERLRDRLTWQKRDTRFYWNVLKRFVPERCQP